MNTQWAASALAWWEEAGVDVIVGERPRDWLAPPGKPAVPPETPAPAALPDTLEGFQSWLAATGDLPFASPSARRAVTAGNPASGLMVMVGMPAVDGSLLSGEGGALFDRMLAAIGRSRETIYLAPLSPFRPPTGRIDGASKARLGAIARHHIGLVAPKAVLLFGDNCGQALIGAVVASARGRWHEIQTQAGPIKALVTMKPDDLDGKRDLKRLVWDDLQMLRDGLA